MGNIECDDIKNLNCNAVKKILNIYMQKYILDKGYSEIKNNTLIKQFANTLKNDKRKGIQKLYIQLVQKITNQKIETARVNTLYDFDKQFGNYKIIAGVDEVGRGPLAGPIVSASVILDYSCMSKIILGINDSKKLSAAVREKLSKLILDNALCVGIGVIENGEIDKKGIGWCNNQVFKLALKKLSIKPQLVLTDGYPIRDFNIKNEYIIKGDAKSASIACASIVAKVYRDRLMKRYSKIYPEYGFEKNVGYGTEEHINAIKRYGITKLHRTSFLKNII